ncbi:MAG: NfeD-like protein [Clostridia bacterium]|nr:NfeD-like protein [Clostridia bacterium]
MLAWWNSLSMAVQVFYCIAIPSTLILVIQTILLFLGIGDDADGLDGIGGDAAPDGPDADPGDGVFGEELATEDPDPHGWDGLRILTFRGIIAFFVVFGWVGVAMGATGASLWLTIPIAFLSGLAMMITLAVLLRAVMRLRSDGNTDNRNAIGTSGRVQLTIPAYRTGEGKVHLMLQGSYVERDAVTDETEPIPTGCEIVVIGVSGQTTLVVKRK